MNVYIYRGEGATSYEFPLSSVLSLRDDGREQRVWERKSANIIGKCRRKWGGSDRRKQLDNFGVLVS